MIFSLQKPANLLLDSSRTVKVCDFGLSAVKYVSPLNLVSIETSLTLIETGFDFFMLLRDSS